MKNPIILLNMAVEPKSKILVQELNPSGLFVRLCLIQLNIY